MKIKNFNIYLAGGISKFGKDEFEKSNSWRIRCKNILENCDSKYKVIVTNPNDYFNFYDDVPSYKSQREIMEFDLNKVRNSDLIIVDFNDVGSLGTMSEIAIAYERRIPVIGMKFYGEKLHPWQEEMTTRIFTNMHDAMEYVKHFYLN